MKETKSQITKYVRKKEIVFNKKIPLPSIKKKYFRIK